MNKDKLSRAYIIKKLLPTIIFCLTAAIGGLSVGFSYKDLPKTSRNIVREAQAVEDPPCCEPNQFPTAAKVYCQDSGGPAIPIANTQLSLSFMDWFQSLCSCKDDQRSCQECNERTNYFTTDSAGTIYTSFCLGGAAPRGARIKELKINQLPTTFTYTLTSPVTLGNGIVIPAGTYTVPTAQLQGPAYPSCGRCAYFTVGCGEGCHDVPFECTGACQNNAYNCCAPGGTFEFKYTNCFLPPPPTATPTITSTPTITPVPTDTPIPTATSVPTETPVPTATPLPTETPTPLPTDTPVPTATPIPTDTPIPTETPTPLPTETPVPTETPIPTSTPLPTSTPVPTNTPIPTNTPVPTATFTPTPTPYCDCDYIEIISGTIAPGQTVTFKTWAIVPTPATNRAEVRHMIYHVKKNGEEIVTSEPIAAIKDTATSTADVDMYYTTWDWTVPSEGSDFVTYYIQAEIICGPRTAADVLTTKSVVLGVSTSKNSILTPILSFFRNLLGLKEIAPSEEEILQLDPNSTPSFPQSVGGYCGVATLLAPTGVATLQLGTFNPLCPSPTPAMLKGCHDMLITIYYGD